MTRYELSFFDQLRAAAAAVQINSSTTFSWLGQTTARMAPNMRQALGEENLPKRLQELITQRLYESFYCKGRPCPIGWDRIGHRSPAHNIFLSQALSTANRGGGYLQDGWRLLGRRASGMLLVERHGLKIRIPKDALGKAETAPQGSEVAVRFGKELTNGLPSFYIAMGDVELEDEAVPTCVRLYWNADPSVAVRLTEVITTHLNRARISFRFKVVNDPTLFNRHDAAVLYLRPEDYDVAFEALREELPALLTDLRPGIPALTRFLAPGLAVAEDPGETGTSFGLHRCRRIAEGLVAAAEEKTASLEGKMRLILEHFETAGLDPERPYLRPDSVDRYGVNLPQARAVPPPEPAIAASDPPFSSTTYAARASYTTIDSKEIAHHLAMRLVRSAIWHGNRCTWIGCEDHLNRMESAPIYLLTTLAPDLYTGNSGIALFLAELFHCTGEPAFRKTAMGALRQSLNGVERSMASRRSATTGEVFPGLYGGVAGVALVARRIAELFPTGDLTDTAQDLLLASLSLPLDDLEKDLVTGVAGALFGLAMFQREEPNPALHEAGRRCALHLSAAARCGTSDASWGSPTFPRTHHLTGYLHGTAGIAQALLEWHAVDDDPAWLELGERAFAYEDRWFDPARGGWPDLRDLGPKEAPRKWPALWCHGAAGIALARARAFEITGQDHHQDMARIAQRTVIREVTAFLEEGRGNFSLAEGLPGSVEAARLAAQILDAPEGAELEALTEAVAQEGFRRYASRDLPWAGGVASGEAPGLFLGLAGIGLFYLRRAHPEVPSALFLGRNRPRNSQQGRLSPLETTLRNHSNVSSMATIF